MLYRPNLRPRQRRAATAVEAAFILPATFFLLYGLLVGGLLVFKYQEVTHIARETARYASVHGSQYAKYNLSAIQAGTLTTVDEAALQTYARGLAITIPPSAVNVTVQVQALPVASTANSGATTVAWNTNATPWSSYTDGSGTVHRVGNLVIVTISTSWSPGIYVYPGSVTISSTSTMPMSF